MPQLDFYLWFKVLFLSYCFFNFFFFFFVMQNILYVGQLNLLIYYFKNKTIYFNFYYLFLYNLFMSSFFFLKIYNKLIKVSLTYKKFFLIIRTFFCNKLLTWFLEHLFSKWNELFFKSFYIYIFLYKIQYKI